MQILRSRSSGYPQHKGGLLVLLGLFFSVSGSALAQKSYIALPSASGVAITASSDIIKSSTFGAKGDGKVVNDAVVTAGSTIVTSRTANWSTADIGKVFAIPYAGADNGVRTVGKTFITKIIAVNSSTSIQLAAAPTKSIGGLRNATTSAMISGTNILTSAVPVFAPGDIGKKVTIPAVGLPAASGVSNASTCWITGYSSPLQVTVSRKALATVASQTVTVPGATVYWGTDDTSALQTALSTAATQKQTLNIEAGRYILTSQLTPASNAHVRGAGIGSTILSPVGSNFAVFRYQANASAPLVDFSVQDLEIDGFGVTVNTYTTENKAIYCRPMTRPIFQNLYIHDTSATGIGCDFLQYGQIINNRVEHCGRQVDELGGGAGGAGIGLGTGLRTVEATTIMGNTVSDSGNSGILTESQSSNIRSQGIRIIGNYCDWNKQGISDRACDGTVIQGNICNYNTIGIGTAGGFVRGLYSTNTLISGNNCENSFGSGISLDFNSGTMTVKDNSISGGSTGNAGILFNPSSFSTRITLLTIYNNTIHNTLGSGIYIIGGPTFDSVRIDGNTIWDFGESTSLLQPAIRIGATIDNLYVTKNIISDTRLSLNRFSSYPLYLESGTYLHSLYDGNDARNLSLSNNPDTSRGNLITPLISHFNP